MKTTSVERVFKYQNRILPDANPAMSPEQIRDLHAAMHPELASASIQGPEIKRGKKTYTFVQHVGTKG